MGPHFTKYHLEMPGRPVIHHLTEPDRGDAHDHPFAIDTMIVFGGYTEEVYGDDGTVTLHTHRRGDSFRIEAGRIHRIIDLPEGECVTVAVYHAPERVPGFYRWEDGVALYRRHDRAEFEPVEDALRR